MTEQEIASRIYEIEQVMDDGQMAHGLEKSLNVDFIKYVAECGPPELAHKARLVLVVNAMKFDRYI